MNTLLIVNKYAGNIKKHWKFNCVVLFNTRVWGPIKKVKSGEAHETCVFM